MLEDIYEVEVKARALYCELTINTYVIRSGKTSLIAAKYTQLYHGNYCLLCVGYTNSISFIEFLRIFCIQYEVCIKILCSEKELLNLLAQNLQGNKTGFARPGDI